MDEPENTTTEIPFGPTETLHLHQLRLLEWMATTGRKRFTDEETSPSEIASPEVSLPEKWSLTKGIKPFEWQEKCIANWRANDGHGTVKVVTGGGKTLLAMVIAERLQNDTDPELRLAIVVPTIVLLHQWYDAFREHGNLPLEAIGRLGGGYSDDFDSGKRVLISVLASASQQLAKIVKKAGIGDHLLLVADECHRAGAKETSQIFKTERRWSLGLSATPEREDDSDEGYDESLLGKELGRIIYEFNLSDALREGLVPKFTINHFGLPMNSVERNRYESLSRSITDSMSKLRGHRDSRSAGGDFFAWARNVATRNRGEVGAIAMRFVSDTSKRRELLNRLDARHIAVEKLINIEFALNKDARVILFHESINEVMDLYVRLRAAGLPVIAEHSELPGSIREMGLDLFRRGVAQVIVSARSLIEGFNVPAVDVGIIVASSGSVRQRIQSLGRVLRRHRGPNGEEKSSCIYVLYADKSSEEHIYGKVDWDATTGVEQNRYFLWDLESEPRLQDGPPQTPLPSEAQVNASLLESGDIYPGQYEGPEFSCDSKHNIRNADDEYASNSQHLAEAVIRVKGGPGKFKITPKKKLVLVRVPIKDEWETLFVAQLKEPLAFTRNLATEPTDEEIATWLADSKVGSPYPFSSLPILDDGLRFKRKSGGIISKKVRGGEAFARGRDRAIDKAKGEDSELLVASALELQNAGIEISKIEINKIGHALYREGGNLFFICSIRHGLEFPDSDSQE
jgi:superfamily II DNA or RNA helicase